MKNKGFTLVELLVTILLIGLIAVITLPSMVGIIDYFEEESFKKGIEGVLRTIRNDADNIKFSEGSYRVVNGTLKYQNRIIKTNGTLKGEGTIIIDEDGDVKLGIKYNNVCATKDFNDNIISYTATCDIPIIETLVDYSFMKNITLNTAISNASLTGFQYSPTISGPSTANNVTIDTNPWGKQDIMWKGLNDPAGDYDGGFLIGDIANNHIPIDNKKSYRFSVWVKNAATTGIMYLYNTGLYSSNTSAFETLYYVDGTGATTNPTITTSVRNEWLLMVGYLNHYGSIFESTMPAVYQANGTVLASTTPRKMNPTTTHIRFRTMRYTATDGYGLFYRPRIDVINGNEPTINDLLAGLENSNLYNN